VKRLNPDITIEEPLFEDFVTETIIREHTTRSVQIISERKESPVTDPETPPYPLDTPVPDIPKNTKRVFIDTVVFDREEKTRILSPSDREIPRPKLTEEEKISFVTGDQESPKLIIDTLEEPAYGLTAKRETMRLVINSMEDGSTRTLTRRETTMMTINREDGTSTGYFVHQTPQPQLTGTVETPVSESDKSTSILAGFGVLVVILLVSVLITIAPLIAGAAPAAAGHQVQPAAGSADPLSAQDLPAVVAPVAVPDPALPANGGSGSGPGDGSPAGSSDLSAVPGLFTNAATSLISGTGAELGLTPGPLAGSGPVISDGSSLPPQSYVTLQPVPVVPTTPLPDLGAALPVPVEDNYVTIYSMENQPAQQNLPYVLFNLANPPLMIDYDVSPMNITDVKELDYKIMATEHHDNLTINRPYEQSWFSVIVRDNQTGEIVEEDGYGKSYTQESPKELALYKAGNYRFEFSGSHAVVNLTMKVKKEGNIE